MTTNADIAIHFHVIVKCCQSASFSTIQVNNYEPSIVITETNSAGPTGTGNMTLTMMTIYK